MLDTMLPLEDMSYQATTYIVPSGNGLPSLDISANSPQGWVAQQVALRDPTTPPGSAQAGQNALDNATAQAQAILNDTGLSVGDRIAKARAIMSGALGTTGTTIQNGVTGAESAIAGSVTNGITGSIPGVATVEEWLKGGAKALVLVLVGILALAFGIWQLTKD